MKQNIQFFNINKGVFSMLFLLFSLLSQAQENHWKAKPKGDNPWATESNSSMIKEDNSSITHLQVGNDSILEESIKTAQPTNPINPTDISSSINTRLKDRDYLSNKSTATERFFNFNDTIILFNTESDNYYKKLRTQGGKMHQADLALGMGIASASVISFFAFPFNIVATAFPTPLINYKIKQFIADNPHATKKEIDAIKAGISGKRISKAANGVALGIVVNLVAILALSNI
jgi:hypothetical protein